MSELIVAGFQGTHRAAEVLDQIVELRNNAEIDLEDAVAVYLSESGKLRVDSSVRPTSKEGARWGGILGVLIGSLLALPVTAGGSAIAAAEAFAAATLAFGASGAALGADAAADSRADHGISEDFLKEVAGMMRPGQSAVIVLAHSDKPQEVAEHFRGYGATILRTTLSKRKAQRLQQVIGGEGASAR